MCSKSVHKREDSESRSQPKLSCRVSKSFRPLPGSTSVWECGSHLCWTQMERLACLHLTALWRDLAQRLSHYFIFHSFTLVTLDISKNDWIYKFMREYFQANWHYNYLMSQTVVCTFISEFKLYRTRHLKALLLVCHGTCDLLLTSQARSCAR